jgi:hypothetical protein
MPNPVGSSSSPNPYTEAVWSDPPAEAELHDHIDHRLDQQTWGACHDPQTVVGAMVCDDKTAASNVCRLAKPGSFDDLLCDDKGMHGAQNTALDVAWRAVQLVLGAKMSK